MADEPTNIPRLLLDSDLHDALLMAQGFEQSGATVPTYLQEHIKELEIRAAGGPKVEIKGEREA